ncbi:Gfo/Idh/MocA family protein [Brachybacterium saurashtrense]|uniref:Gfo/Idh/MocA family oxidoreductase n=1 Tax=Brachybacterium saurashtrense TaxID=556288 RepID=A0A345YS99_9MICO|nr:Gfo/Idh/MocA family oxidoreductase [Brachybacterium saurashtrense]AXK46801.1 gfo/Idh/MocA family oxidoreductase [Brachybacterium saurashtrense]RRR22516.1 gfo/Idh/MocA family oxidoreductase [Brachybacterium saurashtrense]
MTVTLPVRIGLIGGGGIANAHLTGYAAIPDRARITAIADVNPEALAARTAETGATGYADFHELVQDPEVDAVDICLPHHLHRDAIVAAARAGKHILCEKPLCLSAEEATEVREAVEAAGVTLMCAHNQLFMPAVAEAKKVIDSGALGTVYEVRTTDSFHNDFDPSTMGWRAHAATSGGGEYIDTGYHPTYLLMHLAGGTPVQAFAMMSTHRLTFMEGEDSAQVLVRFDNGSVGQLVTSWAYDAAPGTDRFSVVGEKGSLSSDGSTLRVKLRGEEEQVIAHEPIDTFAAEIADFVTCLETGRRPLNTEAEGIAVLGIILAAYESARSGKAEEVLSV